MALIKTVKNKPTGDFTGFFESGIGTVQDVSDNYDWADVWLNIPFTLKGSQYPQIHQIKGSFKKEADGTIEVNKMIRSLNYFFDVIGFTGGLNTMGEWETADGDPIDSIQDALNEHITKINGGTNPMIEPSLDYYIYVYWEAPREKGDKLYKRVLGKITRNTTSGKKDLQSYVDFMTSQGHLKEASEEDKSPTKSTKTTMPF